MRRVLFTVVVLAVTLVACGGNTAPAAGSDPVAAGRRVYQANCAVCHGDRGEGIVGPAFDGVVETFPACDDQLHWIRLGSEGWKEEVGPVYGAQAKPIERPMPRFDDTLSDSEIRLVAIYERSQFGGADPAQAIEACGLQAIGSGD